VAEIRGLTLWRPWAWAIAYAGKRIENRPWRFPAKMLGQYVAIHAGKTLDKQSVLDMRGGGYDVPADGGTQGIVAVAKLAYCFDGDADKLAEILGEKEALTQIDTWLDTESFGWVLADVVAIDPVPCRGAQGLWPLPPDVLSLVRQQLLSLGFGEVTTPNDCWPPRRKPYILDNGAFTWWRRGLPFQDTKFLALVDLRALDP
jgi:hypothetical protein